MKIKFDSLRLKYQILLYILFYLFKKSIKIVKINILKMSIENILTKSTYYKLILT